MRINFDEIDYVIIEEGQTELSNVMSLYLYRGLLLILTDANNSLYKYNGMMKVIDVEFSDLELGDLADLAYTVEEMVKDLPKKITKYTKVLQDLRI